MEKLRCQVCGTKIPAGGVFYTARTEIISGSDGILPDSGESGDALIDRALGEIKELSEQESMEEIYQEIKLVLCGRCRLVFRDTILEMVKW